MSTDSPDRGVGRQVAGGGADCAGVEDAPRSPRSSASSRAPAGTAGEVSGEGDLCGIEVLESSRERRLLRARLRIVNLGARDWGPGDGGQSPVRLGVRGCIGGGRWLDLARHELERLVQPGQAVDLLVSTRIFPGLSKVQFDLVREGCHWFGERGGRTAELTVHVEPDPVELPVAVTRCEWRSRRLFVELHVGAAPLAEGCEVTEVALTREGVETSCRRVVVLVESPQEMRAPAVLRGSIRLPEAPARLELRTWCSAASWRFDFARPPSLTSADSDGLSGSIAVSCARRGREIAGSVRVSNTGDARFLAWDRADSSTRGIVKVGILEQEASGDWVDRGRLELPLSLAPGESTEIPLHHRVRRSTRRLAFDLVAERVTWFSELGEERAVVELAGLPRWSNRWQERLGRRDDRRRRRALPRLAPSWQAVRAALRGLLPRRELEPWRPRSTELPGRARPRVLIVTPYHVHPADHGGAVRLSNLIRELADQVETHVLIAGLRPPHPSAKAALLRHCRSVTELTLDNVGEAWRAGLPPSAGLYGREEVAETIRRLVREHRIEILQLECAEMAQYAEVAGSAKCILVEQDLGCVTLGRRLDLAFPRRYPESRSFGSTRAARRRLLAYEHRFARLVDRVVAMSEHDRGVLVHRLGIEPETIAVIPNAARIEPQGPTAMRPSCLERRPEEVLFLGNYEHLPNLDALDHLLEEIWPLVRAARPRSRLTVAGSRLPPRIPERWHGQAGIRCVGYVPDLEDTLRDHRLLVVPLRVGSGTRLKIVQAFAAGLPVVASSIGVEGLPCEDGVHYLRADTPLAVARAIHRLLDEPEIAGGLADRAQSLVRELLDWKEVAADQLALYRELVRPDLALPAVQSLPRAVARDASVSIVIPTRDGGEVLRRCLEAIARQRLRNRFEVVCVDSGSSEEEIEAMRALGARVSRIAPEEFDHGATRDLGASSATGELLVFLNQDAVPVGDRWLAELIRPFFQEDPPAAVQGGFVAPDEPDPGGFFWGTNGPRFHFTSESLGWMRDHWGCGFSTVHCAIQQTAWNQLPLGPFAVLEDKYWQLRAQSLGWRIAESPNAKVEHRHGHASASQLLRRLRYEGYGWRLVGRPYRLRTALEDALRPATWRELFRGLRRGEVSSLAELAFPVLRPLAIFEAHRLSGLLR
ncbi:MAG: glycosyltransferase [Acidobacteria bacterium]|nr:MAG: glycosyltransferase [Acidobacteriota bacterium]